MPYKSHNPGRMRWGGGDLTNGYISNQLCFTTNHSSFSNGEFTKNREKEREREGEELSSHTHALNQ